MKLIRDNRPERVKGIAMRYLQKILTSLAVENAFYCLQVIHLESDDFIEQYAIYR